MVLKILFDNNYEDHLLVESAYYIAPLHLRYRCNARVIRDYITLLHLRYRCITKDIRNRWFG